MKSLLIIAYGNPLRGDDGVGWQAAELLIHKQWAEEVPILTRHQLTPELAERISEASRVIFVDAHAGISPGEIQARRIIPDAEFSGAFTHHLTPESLLAAAREFYGRCPEAWLFSVTGGSFALQETLSPAVSASLPHLLNEIEQCASADSKPMTQSRNVGKVNHARI
ncbi:MAG: hydrogenase maturation protease [Anaerolineae bacterium]